MRISGMPGEVLQIRVRKAARALGRHNLVHAYGHVSARIDDECFLVCAAQPMGQIAAGTQGTIVPINGDLPQGVLGEVRIHREIYLRRPDVGGIARTMPRDIMSLSALRLTPKPRHGFGSYFHPGIPLWDSPLLIRDDKSASDLAQLMGACRGLVMRGNGLITAGGSIEEAVVLAWYAEDAARVEHAVLAAGNPADAPLVTAEEAAVRATWSGQILERMWNYLTFGDEE